MKPGALTLLFFAAAVPAKAAILYDAGIGTLPASQGWSWGLDPLAGNSATQSVASGALTLDTTKVKSDKAGYVQLPQLNSSTGYQLNFSLRLLAETHAGSDRNRDGVDDRAGFSVIALGNDSRGVEIAFWTDRVWAQSSSPLFTQAERKTFDTTAAVVDFALTVQGDQYALSANGAALIGGPLRNYSSFGAPYNVPNFLFLGDNTTSASAKTEIASVTLAALPIPEPHGAALGAIAVACLVVSRRLRAGRRPPC